MHSCIVLGRILRDEEDLVGVTVIDVDTLVKEDIELSRMIKLIDKGEYRLINVRIVDEELEPVGYDFIDLNSAIDAETREEIELTENVIVGRSGGKFIVANQSRDTRFLTYSQLRNDLACKTADTYYNARYSERSKCVKWSLWDETDIECSKKLDKYRKKYAIMGISYNKNKFIETLVGIRTNSDIAVDNDGNLVNSSFITELNEYNFYNIEKKNRRIKLGKNIKFIESFTFMLGNTECIDVLDMSESRVEDLCAESLYNCKALEIKLPNRLLTIQSWALHQCSMIKSIIIPDSVEYIGSKAFIGTDSLSRIVAKKDLYKQLERLEFDEGKHTQINSIGDNRIELIIS